jgi:uncharacterized membrane protein
MVTVLDLILLAAFSDLKIWKLKTFWGGCGFAIIAYITSILAFNSAIGIAVSVVEVISAATWSCLLSKDLQTVFRAIRSRAGLVSRRGAL